VAATFPVAGASPHGSFAPTSAVRDAVPHIRAQTDLLSAQDGDLLTGVRTIIATYREDLTYLPATALPVPTLRYFDVEIRR